jgi:hypothetical protein
MSQNTGYTQDGLTSLLAHLPHVEQLQVVTTHPFFTGACPECQHLFGQQPMLNTSPWDCPQCGWCDYAWGVASEP